MMDKQTEQFFDHWNEHCLSDFCFLRSQSGSKWFRELRYLAEHIPAENWRKYALWLVGEAQKAVDHRDSSRFTALSMNAFDNQMRLIWA